MFRIVALFIISLLLTSCLTKKPLADNLGSEDSNGRRNVYKPYIDRTPTRFAKASPYVTGLGGGGAVTGLTWAATNNLKTTTIVGTATTLGLYGLTYLGSRLITRKGKKYQPRAKRWIKLYNKKNKTDYIVLEQESANEFRIIRKKYEQLYFTIYSIDDANDYHAAFPNSPHFNDVVKRSIKLMYRNEIPKFLAKYATPYSTELQTEYYVRSNSFTELEQAEKTYPQLKLPLEERYYNFISDCNEASRFLQKYPSTGLLDKLQLKAVGFIKNKEHLTQYLSLFKSKISYPEELVNKGMAVLPLSDLPYLIEQLPNSPNINEAKLKYVNGQLTFRNYASAVNTYPELLLRADKSESYHNYSWCRDEISNLMQAANKGLESYNRDSLVNYILVRHIKHKIDNAGKSTLNGAMALRDYVNYNSLFASVKDYFKTELDKYVRKAEFQVVKTEGIESLIAFCKRYPGTEEANSAKYELDMYVTRNVEVITSGISAATGDRGWVNDAIDVTQSLLGGTSLFLLPPIFRTKLWGFLVCFFRY